MRKIQVLIAFLLFGIVLLTVFKENGENIVKAEEVEETVAQVLSVGEKDSDVSCTNAAEKRNIKSDILMPGNSSVGVGGVYAFDTDDLGKGNPWNEDLSLTKLPVFVRNGNVTTEQLKTAAGKLAKGLGLICNQNDGIILGSDCRNVTLTGTLERANTPASLYLDTDGTFYIDFGKDGFSLPSGYADKKPEEAAKETTDLLADTLGKSVFGGFDIERYFEADPCMEEGRFTSVVYLKGNNAVENIVNYHFNTMLFVNFCSVCGTDIVFSDDKICGIYGSISDFLESAGDYPIISLEEAKKQLLSGQCYAYHDLNFVEENISKVEIRYSDFLQEDGDVYMPFYCFWIMAPAEYKDEVLPDLGGTGAGRYYACYVPAIAARYLDLPSCHMTVAELAEARNNSGEVTVKHYIGDVLQSTETYFNGVLQMTNETK